jgi:hypothetical protein
MNGAMWLLVGVASPAMRALGWYSVGTAGRWWIRWAVRKKLAVAYRELDDDNRVGSAGSRGK